MGHEVILSLTHKQILELKFWIEEKARDNYAAERVKSSLYMYAFDLWVGSWPVDRETPASLLEIGTGPYWGLLPMLRANVRVACDPLFPAFEACGLLEDRRGILRVDEPFEAWETNDTFDAILSTNALDHGEMGFYLLPKMWRMLKPGGRLYLHVHLRPVDLLNLVHDHQLTEEQLDKHLSYTDLVCEKREVLERDVDGQFCKALVGVWRKP